MRRTVHLRIGRLGFRRQPMYLDIAVPGLGNVWMTLEVDSQRRVEREAEFCRNFVCCGVTLQDLHDLLEHHEDVHALGRSGDLAALEAYYGVGPTRIPLAIATSPQSPPFWGMDHVQRSASSRSTAHKPTVKGNPVVGAAGGLISPASEALAKSPAIDSGYASPGSGARSPSAVEEEVHANPCVAKSYSAFFGMFAECAGADVRAAAASRGMKRRLDRPKHDASSASHPVNLHLVTDKLSLDDFCVSPSVSPGLPYPSPAATPPAEVAINEVRLTSLDFDLRRDDQLFHHRNPEVPDLRAEKRMKSVAPPATTPSSDLLVCRRPSTSSTVSYASTFRSGGRSSEKPWACPVRACPKRFRLAGGLKYHLENRHLAAAHASHTDIDMPRRSTTDKGV